MVEIENISFEQFKEIKHKLACNVDKIRKDHKEVTGRPYDNLYNLPRNSYWVTRGQEMLDSGDINESNFKSHWFCCRLLEQWNSEFYGSKFEDLYEEYKKIAADTKYINILKKICKKAQLWGIIRKNTVEATEQDRFVSFWTYSMAYGDTKGAWRHWFDSFCHNNRFATGSIVELRSRVTHNHLWHEKIVWEHVRLRSTPSSEFSKMREKTFIVLGYDQKEPPVTYSYKPSMGSHRMVTVLPLGEAKTYFISEQFLKISRKQAIKDARRGKK